uniref:RNA 2-O ribose methyltransferase substrate binding domain-containing protein n=1 Tax=Sander lucioperca TaxID=283035 RepID=A0A8C9YX87_SANLU
QNVANFRPFSSLGSVRELIVIRSFKPFLSVDIFSCCLLLLKGITAACNLQIASQIVIIIMIISHIHTGCNPSLPLCLSFRRLVSVARSRTSREHQGKILLEGRRLICDALDAGANPQMVFFSTLDRLRELPLDKLKRATLVKVKFEDIKIWSDLVAPQGVIAIFSRPDPSRLNFAVRSHSVPLSLICDNIRDPGNLGTMLRCAAAAGCHSVLLTKGCVDAWEPKVLRAAMGAHFRLPIYSSLGWDDVEKHLPKPVTVHVADSSCAADASKEKEDSQVNASHKSSKAGDYGWVSTRPNQNNMRYEEYDSDSDSDCEDGGLSLPRLDSKLYHESWAQSPTALVIGGETHGLSVEAVQLAEKTAGHRLFIPVAPDVDSLNSAMATSILLFEGRKQLLKKDLGLEKSEMSLPCSLKKVRLYPP